MDKSENIQRPSRRRRKIGRWIVLAVTVLGAGIYAALERPWEPRPIAVATAIAEAGPVSQVLALNGRIAANRSVAVRSAVSAQVLRIGPEVGEEISERALLAILDSTLAEAQVHQARAALDAQRAKQSQAQAAVERALALGQNTPRSALEDAEFALTAAVNETARLASALELAQRQVEQYTILAPIGGIVLSRSVDLGQLVDPQTALFIIADTSELVVETDVDELYSSRVGEGLKALLMPVGATVARHGTVTFAAPTVDSATGGRAIKISFDEPVDLPVGITVSANVIVDEVSEALSLPRGAIITEGARSHVLVVEQGVATEREIVFNDWPAERVIVTDGLVERDVVILDPTAVSIGDLVTPE